MPCFYINVRENPTSTKLYRNITHLFGKEHELEEVKSKCDSILSDKSIVILDEIDFLQDYVILYHITKHTKVNLILLTQKVYWYKNMNDGSVKSSLQPDHIVFHEHNTDETLEISKMRARESLNEYNKESLGLLSALLVRDFRSDAGIGIKAKLLSLPLTKKRLQALRRIWRSYREKSDWKKMVESLGEFLTEKGIFKKEVVGPFDASKLKLIAIDFIS